MKQLKSISAIAAVFFVLCSFKGEIKPFKNTEWIPKDFDTRNGVLLVQEAAFNVPPKQNQKITGDMKEIMQQNFPFKYEFAPTSEISSDGKYADKDKYRWALVTTSIKFTSQHFDGTLDMVVNAVDFHIYDRKNDKKYAPTKHSNSFVKPVMAPTVVTLVKYLKELPASK